LEHLQADSCFVFPDFHRPRLQQRPTPVHIMPAISAHSGEGPGGHILHPPLCSKGCAIRTCLPNEKYPQCLSMIYLLDVYIYIYSSIHLIYYINSYYIITTIILIQRSSPVPHVSPPARFVPATSPAPGRPGASASRRRCWATPRASPATWVTPTACGRPGGARRPAAELARSRQKMVEQCGKMWKVSMKS
jgi:hypothetical protein